VGEGRGKNYVVFVIAELFPGEAQLIKLEAKGKENISVSAWSEKLKKIKKISIGNRRITWGPEENAGDEKTKEELKR
jgi:hypothetical protein